MSNAMNVPTSIQAEIAEKALDKRVAAKATDKKRWLISKSGGGEEGLEVLALV